MTDDRLTGYATRNVTPLTPEERTRMRDLLLRAVRSGGATPDGATRPPLTLGHPRAGVQVAPHAGPDHGTPGAEPEP